MLKLNNVITGKLLDINYEDSYEENATKIAKLFLDDGLDDLYIMHSEEKNLYETLWSEICSELFLKK